MNRLRSRLWTSTALLVLATLLFLPVRVTAAPSCMPLLETLLLGRHATLRPNGNCLACAHFSGNETFDEAKEKFGADKRAYVGGEGEIYLSEKYPLSCLKVWVKNRRGDFVKSVQLLLDAAEALRSPKITKLRVVKVCVISEAYSWIIREFRPHSLELKEAMRNQDKTARRTRSEALRELDALIRDVHIEIQNQNEPPGGPLRKKVRLLQDIRNKIYENGGNVHYTPSEKNPNEGLLYIIDMQ